MGIREYLQQKKGVSAGLSGGLVLLAVVIIAAEFWPAKKAKLEQVWFTDDDGVSWFADSTFLVPPFQHNGKTAVGAVIFSYANGSKQYCAWESKYNDDAKKQLEAALADAQTKGQPASSVPLLTNPEFTRNNTLVKLPGKGDWLPPGNAAADMKKKGLIAPDGNPPTDQVFVY